MPHLIEVAFKGNRKEFFLWEADEVPSPKAAVIVEADRGEDLGRVHATGELAAKRSAGVPHGLGAEGAAPARKALRLASPDDVKRAAELGEQNESARRRAMERVKANGLVMKLTDAEWQWDRKKLTFYFTAEKRVDFRNLVRDLASMFRTRIELKQIGVRDEARRLDGIGRCGRQYCSSSWLPELRPVNLGVAKDQRLSLNPTQISGACGRLMCSLRYEHEFYVQSRKRFPKEGKILVTSLGEEKVVANDIFHDRVTLRRPDGDARVVALADLKREVAAAAGDANAGAAAAAVAQGDDEHAAVASPVDDALDAGEELGADERAEGSGAGAGERRQEGRRARSPERSPRDAGSGGGSNGSARAVAPPRTGPANAGANAGANTGATGAPADTPGANTSAGAWLRMRSPLPQAPAPRDATPAAPPAPPAQPTTAASETSSSDTGVGADVTPSATPAAGADESADRRARRRRGRRGGRRGRGGGGGDRTAAGATDAQGSAGADDDGDTEAGDDGESDGGATDASANQRTTDHRE